MSDDDPGNNISWTHFPGYRGETWNTIRGCTHAGTPGCDHCWAEGMARRFDRPGMWGDGLTKLRTGGEHKGERRWSGVVKTMPERLEIPMRWRKPRAIFVNSTADLFHPSVPFEFIAAQFGVFAACPRHIFMVLTKRAARMREFFEWLEKTGKPTWALADAGTVLGVATRWTKHPPADWRWPLPNVILMTTTEDQQRADDRIPELLACPAAVHGLSVEPMLGPIVLPPEFLALGSRAWVVCGGESGPGARPMHPDWARSLRDQCVEAGAAYHFKQKGAWTSVTSDDPTWTHMLAPDGRTFARGEDIPLSVMTNMSAVAFVKRVGKKAAGRMLDGRTWDEFPDLG